MNELMQQWIENLSEFGKYIEYHVIEGEIKCIIEKKI